MMPRALSVLFVGALVSLQACASAPATDEVETVSRADAITGGTVDTTHQAVMLESCDKPCICTGTLVKKDEATGVGWVVTAAHCIPGLKSDPRLRFYVQGDKAATFSANYVNTIEPGAIRYPVLDATRDPQYDPNANPSADAKQEHDIGIIRILGVGKDSPVMALGTETDGLAKGATIVSIGYGATGAFNDEKNLGAAGTRHSASVKISDLTTTFITASGKDPGGFVNVGDSGGPDVAMVDGVERLVGIHSAGVDNLFRSVRQSTRVSAEVSFLQGELGKAPTLDCNTCLRIETGGTRECAPQTRTCLDDADCNAYVACLETCEGGFAKDCRDSCKASHAQGAALHEPAFACGCQACATTCGNTCPAEYLQPKPSADAGAGNPNGTDGGDSSPTTTSERPAAVSSGCSMGSSGGGGAWPAFIVLGALTRRRRRG